MREADFLGSAKIEIQESAGTPNIGVQIESAPSNGETGDADLEK